MPPRDNRNKAAAYLGGDVIGSAAERFRRPVAVQALLAHAEVGDLDVPVLVEQDVVQLEIPVDDAATVQEEQADRYFRRVKPDDEIRVDQLRE